MNRGREDWLPSRSPLPPNRTSGSPTSGSPVGGVTSKRVDRLRHRPPSGNTAHAPQRRSWAGDDGRCPSACTCALPSRLRLPPPLRSTGVTPLPRYYGRSDSCPAGSSAPEGHEHRPVPGHVSLFHEPGLCGHSASTHPTVRRRRFRTRPLRATAPPRLREAKASPLASRLAGPAKPYRVRHPADWSLAFGCSPPPLTRTQFPSATGRSASA